ncbi:MAG: tetratricopeptide repeat-containing serine protease family protein, partial [Verrucomicrobiota bacterium]
MTWKPFLIFFPALLLTVNFDCQSAGNEVYAPGNFDKPISEYAEQKAKAEKGDAEAQYYMGRINSSGEYLCDYGVAIKWLRLSAAQGNEKAIKLLPEVVQAADQNGVGPKAEKALEVLKTKADNGDAISAFTIGCAYYEGKGVDPDPVKSLKYFQIAAEKGIVAAQYNLGVCYNNGKGVEKDVVEAVRWYRKAAERGDALAQYQLGLRHYYGNGVLVDYVEAVKWNALAAAQGNDDAVKTWNYVLKEKVPADQIAEGQRRAASFVPKNGITEQQTSSSINSNSPADPTFTGTGFFITDDGYLISNYHVVKGAVRVRLLTGTGLIDATVVKVDAANDLALLNAAGKFAPLPVAASRTVKLGGSVATVGFPSIGLQGFSPKLAKGEIASLAGASDDPRYFQISVPVQP